MLIWTNFDSFVSFVHTDITRWLHKFHLAIEVVLNFLQIENRLELVFVLQVFVEIFAEIFTFEIRHELAKFIKGFCLLISSFSEMYLMFYANSFDDVMKFEIVKF